MPISFYFSDDLHLVYARWTGVIDLASFQANFDAFLNDINYVPGRPELIDLSGIERLDLDFPAIRLMLRQVNTQDPTTRVTTRTVIWAPNDEAYGTGRMYQQMADFLGGITVEIYRDGAEALGAYGLDVDSMQALRDGYVWQGAQRRAPNGRCANH